MCIDLSPEKRLQAIKKKEKLYSFRQYNQDKGDTYGTNKFIENNEFIVLEEAVPELSYIE